MCGGEDYFFFILVSSAIDESGNCLLNFLGDAWAG